MSTKCDFCGELDPEWVYPAKDLDVDVGSELGRSFGAWTACETCSKLIEHSQRAELTERAMDGPAIAVAVAVGLLTPDERKYVKDLVLKMHGDFFRNRTGARRRFG